MGFLAILASLGLWGCALHFKPLPDPAATLGAGSAAQSDPRMVARFFDDDFVAGGYQYTYPDAAKVFIPEESGHESEVSLQFDLEAGDYSGGSVCLYNLMYDLTPYYSRGALRFWIKGARGGEIAWVALVDDENRDGKKTVVRIPLNDNGGITNEWRQVSIPLTKFGRKGVFWDAKNRIEVPMAFDWNAVTEFRIEIKKAENPSFRVWVDDIAVLRDVYDAVEEKPSEDWQDKQETIAMPLAQAGGGKVLHTLFGDAMPQGGFTYVYGGKTAAKVQPGSPAGGTLAAYMDPNEYSGVTLALGEGKNLDLRGLRAAKGALCFWGKGAPGVRSIYLGLLDSRPDGIKAQSKLVLGDFGPVDTAWNYFRIPLKRFGATGMYWDAAKSAEISTEVKWDQINEIRFSENKDENKIPPGQPIAFYAKDIVITEDIPGYVDPDEYWNAFSSKSPDLLLHDFEAGGKGWETGKGPKSEVAFEADAIKGRPGKSLGVTYRLADWCDVLYRYDVNGSPGGMRDWTGHYGIRVSIYTPKAFQGVTIQVHDAGNEVFVANTGATRGWNDILVPFRNFVKFPYYQPPDAVQNGKLDLQSVRVLDFKPAGDGTSGSYRVDDVTLTNLREAPKRPVVARRDFQVSGQPGQVITAKINDGLFGINAALWDGDLLDGKTEAYVKAARHQVVRYPGGLRADDDHWRQVLDKKDGMVDTDEFLEWLKRTGNEGMFTVNFGKGTPQEAADWVKYVNVTKNAKVRLWEVGNELYGDWHPQHTTGDEYGKRAAAFIKAMKAADPAIQVAVVAVLDGEWNKQVLAATKDLADAVIIHHYPQHSGEENDQALLAAPQSLDEIIPSVRRQLKTYGNPDREYGIWLTEWNSVDFKPGPQTLSLANGLFVADYLGMLARHNIDEADYWDIHNNLTEQGGDYGYLSRTGAQDGDIVPRPSYHAFKLASESLRGRLLGCKVVSVPGAGAAGAGAAGADAESDLSCYLTQRPDGTHSVLLINKHPETAATVTLTVPGLKGAGILKRLDASNAKTGPGQGEALALSETMKLTLPAHSLVSVSQK
ncbi:MAG: Carbohydrate binding family 11 [Fibrobacteres bacterium]|nr:Carbohydrate binding family 11 [Fibrobacterota bacterium]